MIIKVLQDDQYKTFNCELQKFTQILSNYNY